MYMEKHSNAFFWRKQSYLGKPPGLPKKLSVDTTVPRTNNNVIKIAPLKEIEQVIQDLKKENFDLKLRLYHLEDTISTRLSLHQQSLQLRSDLQVQNQRMTLLEQELREVTQYDNMISPAESFYSAFESFSISPTDTEISL